MYPNLRSLSEQIYDWMKERILLGTLAPGERISVDAIASGLGVSRTPIRDALNRLALEGLVVVSPRKGTVVGGLTLKDVQDVYQARYFIEPSICENVAQTASQQLIADLEEIQADWESIDATQVYREVKVTARYVELNAAFHMRIGEETGNGQVNKILHQLYVQPQMTALVFGTSYTGPLKRMGEHRTIIEAFKHQSGAMAREAMTAHLTSAKSDLTGFLQSAKVERRSRAKIDTPDFPGQSSRDVSSLPAKRRSR